MRAVAIIAVSAVAITAVASPAAAQSGFCTAIRSELAALDDGRSGGRSARALRQEIAQTREQMRRAGCRGLFFRKKGRSCGTFAARLNRLERQLSRSSRRGFWGRSYADRERNRLRRALARSGCSEGSGTYQTICVRVCDGYYFPLNFSTSRQRFAADAQKCMSQYAPGEATLYYRTPGGDTSQAVSLSGERYSDQPYAFAYRSTFNRQCAMQLQEGLATLGERVMASLRTSTAVAVEAELPLLSIPIARIDRSSDPETIANRAGRFVPAPVAQREVAVAGGDGSTRIVGVPYLLAEANPGPPPTVPGYKPPELRDFRALQKARMLPGP